VIAAMQRPNPKRGKTMKMQMIGMDAQPTELRDETTAPRVS
jgi:hypothetical protein